MTRRLARVSYGLFKPPSTEEGTTEPVVFDSPTWYTWLEQHRSFSFEDVSGTFTARKEQRPRGWYWYAYRRRQGRLHSAYLGTSQELTRERMNAVARVLATDKTSNAIQQEQSHPLNHIRAYPLLRTKLAPAPVRFPSAPD